jgi:hypothetical protein
MKELWFLQESNDMLKGRMTKEKFASILREYGYDSQNIDELWETRKSDDIDEKRLRITAEHFQETFRFLSLIKEFFSESF